MKKVVFKIFISVFLFMSIWYSFSRINWVSILKIETLTEKTEEKLGDFFWELFKSKEEANKNLHLKIAVDSILNRLCEANNIDREEIKLHILKNDDINAFALPNRQIVVYTGLIRACRKPDELSGVIAHELAHIELEHVMRKLKKELGVNTLLNITVGNKGSKMISEAAQTLTSTAYDRYMEKEADLQVVNYLVMANINPETYADFMQNLSESESKYISKSEWLSTHPDTKKRVDYINNYSQGFKVSGKPILSAETWQRIQDDMLMKY